MMPDGGATVTVADPCRRTAIVARHVGLSTREAWDLAAIYAALGYAPHLVAIAPADRKRAA